MKFIVERASAWGSEEAPCGGCHKEVVTSLFVSNYSSFEEYKKNCREDFRARGYEHKEINGHIERKIDTECWTIEINSMNELMDFMQHYGDVIIYNPIGGDPYKKIVIYDDYIE